MSEQRDTPITVEELRLAAPESGDAYNALLLNWAADEIERMRALLTGVCEAQPERLKEADALLERADEVIEILLGDGEHKGASQWCGDLADYFNKYDEPVEP